MKTKLVLLLSGLLLSGTLTHAAPLGTAFTYQGRLDQNGQPATGSVPMVFQLRNADAATVGTAVGSPINQPVTVANGLFTVDLDFGATAFDGNARWLEVTVNGTLLTPRTRVAPTPHAIYASTAGTVPNGAIQASQLGTVGAAPGPGQVLGYNGSSLVWQAPGGVSSVWTLNGSSAYYNGGNVGIGTGTPLHSLTVGAPETPINLPSLAGFYRAGGAYLTARDTTSHAEVLLGADSTAIIAAMTDHPLSFRAGNGAGSGNAEYMRINRGGNVGIGTTTPTSKLDVNGDGNFRNDLFVTRDLRIAGATSEADLGVFGVSGWAPLGLQPPTRFVVRREGTVGIGTGNPQAALDVRGNWDGGRPALQLGGEKPTIKFAAEPASGNQEWLLHLGSDGPGNLQFFRKTGFIYDSVLALGANGNVGIGTTAPQAKLDVAGNASVCTLTIRGGCDLAEPFPMKEEQIDKGSVVVIDDEHPGRLKRSTQAYDTRVAGIISGANGINPGIALKQEGVLDQGENVALTGRVYVKADASLGAIKPGDLLTTSDTPGHAMKVSEPARAQGAILGKAMTPLPEGTGLVLVLVTLQ